MWYRWWSLCRVMVFLPAKPSCCSSPSSSTAWCTSTLASPTSMTASWKSLRWEILIDTDTNTGSNTKRRNCREALNRSRSCHCSTLHTHIYMTDIYIHSLMYCHAIHIFIYTTENFLLSTNPVNNLQTTSFQPTLYRHMPQWSRSKTDNVHSNKNNSALSVLIHVPIISLLTRTNLIST